MRAKRRRTVAKGVLFIYVLISATFSFSHRDYVPLESKRVISSADALGHYLDTDGGSFVCPAHLFAQSTTATDTQSEYFSSHQRFSFLRIVEHPQYLARPQLTSSSRAPPQA
ncbi:MAG: hypothetical protein M1339_08830 [Bacteroidetes bacterium]|nr:hypothetical protein [Bacteroidota bacterium]